MKVALALLAGTAFLLGVSFVEAPYLDDQVLQHAPTVVALGALTWTGLRGRIRCSAVLIACVFLWLHILGARYIYSVVPYDAWIEAVTGWSVDRAFGLQRNHYDRLVHFMFGLLCVLFIDDLFRDSITRRLRWMLAVMFVGSISALYEVFEWGLASTVSPERALRYNGQQGDLWDAQKDMALAMLGAVVALPFAALFSRTSSGRARLDQFADASKQTA